MNVRLGKLTALDITPLVDWAVKLQHRFIQHYSRYQEKTQNVESASVAQLDARRMWVQSLPYRLHSFMEIDHEIFYGHSLPTPDAGRAVVSFW